MFKNSNYRESYGKFAEDCAPKIKTAASVDTCYRSVDTWRKKCRHSRSVAKLHEDIQEVSILGEEVSTPEISSQTLQD